jgi:predicted transcriptional regulator
MRKPPSRKALKANRVKTSRKGSRPVGRGASLSRIKKLEKRFGQRGLAKILGVSPRSIRRYKEGTRVPRFDVAYKLKRAEAKTRGPRKTKSVKKKRERVEKAIRLHPEIQYFEKREAYKYADTEHVVLYGVRKDEIEDLLEYLRDENCGAAFLVISGVDKKTDKREFYSTEVMELDDFSESWEDLYDELRSRYKMRQTEAQRVDLVGIKYHAPSVIER